MRKIVGLIFILIGYASISQEVSVKWLDSAAINQLKIEDYTFVNTSFQSNLEIEKKTNIILDFSTLNSNHKIDSVQLLVNDSIVSTNNNLSPVLLKDISESMPISIYSFSQGDTLDFKTSGNQKLSLKITKKERPSFASDKIVFGILMLLLAFIFYTSNSRSEAWQKFYRIVPALLLCYVLPAVLAMTGLISKDYSGIYPVARDYLLPAALILMTIGIDFKAVLNLGPKALIMFGTATIGVILGGPIAIMVYKMIDPSVVAGVGEEATWRGMATIAGSWIGGGANQNAMYETYGYAEALYGRMIVVDVVVANMWMAVLLWGAARAKKIDGWLKADSSAIDDLKDRVVNYQSSIARNPSLTDYMVILGVTFGVVAISHLVGKELAVLCESALGKDSPFASSFFWLVVIATTGGLILSTTKVRRYEGAGASKIGSVFIYILVAAIGMKMELAEAVKEPQLILVGVLWMLVHVTILLIVAKLIKAPFFFVAVGSKANIGGAASAPIIASAFHPSLASVGAILAVFGYALGTYGAIACAELMRWVAP